MQKGGFIYILTNKLRTVLYIGVTSNLRSRLWEHEQHETPGSFTDQYNATLLIYYEWFNTINSAIEREKQLKGWIRKKKEQLIARKNPQWKVFNEEISKEIYSLLY
ncbi:excinuclease ABC subunit C [Niabella ginsenosidivorans]|uniref:Excinuclease ABC subunit C n=1 Tax=Niabella ginsenosidivorans TaxID=1176587 RepID=A0A1A9I0I7_9BACT|nr:GIY-YIG nuclease family protein [Niabella ginsenosidivorans]ANH80240.1 excinuclease ABC subunit C [Niabella ginsenosidivorans]